MPVDPEPNSSDISSSPQSGQLPPIAGVAETAPLQLQPSPSQATGVSVRWELESFSGPLPPPSLLRQYDKVIPNAGERFLIMVEQETQHRRSQETARLQAEIDDQDAQRSEIRRGQIFALIIALAGIILGSVISVWQPVAGPVISGVTLVPLVTAFLKRQPTSGQTSTPTAEVDKEQKPPERHQNR